MKLSHPIAHAQCFSKKFEEEDQEHEDRNHTVDKDLIGNTRASRLESLEES